MRLLRFFVVLSLAFVLGGCFVVDELDWGMSELDKHGAQPGPGGPSTAKATPEPAVPAEAAKDSSWEEKVPDVGKWWKEARSLSSSKKDEGIVQCRLDGRNQFMRVEDCQARGGQIGS